MKIENEMTNSGERVQLRGVCCVCARLHALKKDGVNMVNHGYTVEYGYFNGTCHGASNVHYGHKDAPLFIASHIESLRAYRECLPTRIASVAATLKDGELKYREMKADPACDNAARNAMRRSVLDTTGMLQSLNNLYSHGIQSMIDESEKAIANWVEVPPVVVMLDVEAREIRDAKAQAKAIKDAERAAQALAKAQLNAKAEESRMGKAAEYEALISAENHFRLFFEGVAIDSWVAGYDCEQDIYKAIRGKVTAHWLTLGRGGMGFGENYNYFADGRTAAEGKGKRFFQYLVHGTAKAYFDFHSS
ncbi:MAG: hypothetical protein ACRC1W_13460 [Shewanella sp.]